MLFSLLLPIQLVFAGPHSPTSPFANPVEKPSKLEVAAQEKPEILNKIGITEKLESKLDLNLSVTNEKGEVVSLNSFFAKGQPVVLSLVYYACPGLCNFHLNGFFDGLKGLDWSAGQKFQFVALSFDHKEKADLAQAKKQTYQKLYDRAGTEDGLHFVTADEETIRKIADSVGFAFRWDESEQQWAHGSAAVMLSPEGKITRYLHGVIFDPKNIKLALTEAGQGKVGSFVDKMVMYCFKYDPKQSKYVLYAFRLVQLGGGLIVLVLALLLVPTWLRSRREA